MKAAIKADISRQQEMNKRQEARRQGIALGHYRTQLLLAALQRIVVIITVAKCGQWVSLHANIYSTLHKSRKYRRAEFAQLTFHFELTITTAFARH